MSSLQYDPRVYQAVNRFLEKSAVRIIYDDRIIIEENNAPRHFSYKSSRGEYHIYIDTSLVGADYEAADLFEKGHILFGHLDSDFEADEQETNKERAAFERALFAKRSTVLAFLPDDAGKRLSFYTTYLWKRFVETARTIEIKTKLFNNDDAAQEFALEPGLNGKSYLRLLSENPAVSLPRIIGEKGIVSSADISSIININTDMNEQHNNTNQKWGRTLHQTKTAPGSGCTVTQTALRQLPDILKERSLMVKKIKMTNDLFYYENRNKYATGLLMPRRRKTEKLATGNVVILLDVSGSIPDTFTEAAVNAIMLAEAQNTFDAENSRLVRWAANLVDDTALFNIHSITGGGGTVLADGIEYCKRYTGDNSAFFIISDVQDEIADWIERAKTMNARKTVIAYNKFGETMSAAQWFSRAGSNADYRKEEVPLSEWSRHFDTLLVAL
ncbi:MAG: hypothetical protein LBK61_03290 [Spirochaetaceae bacterium]|jgi:hypothetical protein|nr:hypothetical protein [Spirochaetaceae bacterium]